MITLEQPIEFTYREAGVAALDELRPLWERLRDFHAGFPGWAFAKEVAQARFDDRKRELLAKAQGGALRVDLVTVAGDPAVIAYCVSSFCDSRGEIDSAFVEERWRSQGIGAELVRRALAWMEALGATKRIVCVACDNRDAVEFYGRLGFAPRVLVMQVCSDHSAAADPTPTES